MDLVTLLVGLVIFGVCFWLVNGVIPIQPPWLKTCIIVLLAIILILWLLNGMGIVHVGNVHVER